MTNAGTIRTTSAPTSATTTSGATTVPVNTVTTWTRTNTLAPVRAARGDLLNETEKGKQNRVKQRKCREQREGWLGGRQVGGREWGYLCGVLRKLVDDEGILLLNAVSCSEDLSGRRRGKISSPSWPAPYAENANCQYTLSVEDHLQLELEFSTDFDVEQSPDGPCIDALRVGVQLEQSIR